MTNLAAAMSATPSLATLATGLSNLEMQMLPASQSVLVAATQPSQPLAAFDFVKTHAGFNSTVQVGKRAAHHVPDR